MINISLFPFLPYIHFWYICYLLWLPSRNKIQFVCCLIHFIYTQILRIFIKLPFFKRFSNKQSFHKWKYTGFQYKSFQYYTIFMCLSNFYMIKLLSHVQKKRDREKDLLTKLLEGLLWRFIISICICL